MDSATLDLQQAPGVPGTETAGDAGMELFVATASFGQRRLWLLDRMQPGSSAYNVPVAVRLRGPLRTSALAAALAGLTARHETLRTFFDEEDGEPVQVIVPELRPDLPEIDLSGLLRDRAEEEAMRRIRQEAARPFDLGRAPLLRSVLFRLAENGHLLLLNAHHIVTDGWSLGILLRELSALYAAHLHASPGVRVLPDLPIQYADFAAWQREWLQGDVLEQKLRPWRQRLAGAPAGLDLPTDRPRTSDHPEEGRCGHLSFTLGAALSADLRQLARASGCTLFMTLLAGFQALLSRHSGQTDLVVGSPVANRNRLEIEGLIGFFVNTLPLRGDLSGDPGFRQLLERVREVAVDAFAHEDLPFEKLIEELRPDRRLQQNPLFSVLFAVQRPQATPDSGPDGGGLVWELEGVPPATAKLELSLQLVDHPAEILGSWEYDTGLYDEATVARFSRHLQVLLADAVAHPERPLSELRLIDADEEQLLLVELNRPLHRKDHTWAQTATVHELFLQQAEKTPDQIAAVGPQGPMTFRDLAAQASALAHLLQKAAGGPLIDRPVALIADPDPLVLVGILGILQAGGGFVPLDPRHPDERLAWMLEDCSCAALVSQRRHIERASAIGDRLQGLTGPLPIFGLEDAAEAAAEAEAVPAPRGVHEPLSLAYIIYTSGSTGRPKGAQNTHEGLAPQLVWGGAHLGLGPKTRVLQHLSFSFDVGIFELLTTLLAGGTLYFPIEAPGESAGDPAVFAREVLRQDINTLFITPTFARELAGTGQRMDGLETINIGGEMLSRDTVERLRRVAPRATFHNGYGPSEVSITTAMYSMAPRTGGQESEEPGLQSMPVGRPAADNQVYILDRTGRLAPFGARGELCIGGNGVGRGYLGRPDMTAERFLPDPFGSVAGGRLYRSGDLARYLPGGDIEVLGRIDLQVKIRGVRIEPGEVEVVLRDHPMVREVAVAARPDPAGGLRLVGYVVLHRTDPTDPRAELRAFLSQRLPSPLVPSVFVLLGSLPVNVNGKLDRAALPDPDVAAETVGFVAPRTAVEETLAGVWSSVLRLDRIGAFDNFFDLGGHSLTATAVTAKVRSTFQVELPTRAIFKEPVLAGLAEQIETLLRTKNH